MTAADPSVIDTTAWLKKARTRLKTPRPREWTTTDFKLAYLLADKLTRAELLGVLDIAAHKRFDSRAGIDKFLTMMAGVIDARGDDE